MTLSSHPGSALVMSSRSEQFWGHEVNWYVIGDSSKAVKLFFSKYATGYLIRLDSNRRKGLDVAFNKLEEGTEVVSWLSHKGRNQQFMVNDDHTISNSSAPGLVWGFLDGKMKLVKQGSPCALKFD